MRSACLCVVVLLSCHALLVASASTSHDDEADSKKHVITKRHLQPILDRINLILGTGTRTTTPAPEIDAAVVSAGAAPVAVLPAAVVPADVLTVAPPVAVDPAEVVGGISSGSAAEASTTPASLETPALDPVAASVAEVNPPNDASPSREAPSSDLFQSPQDEEPHRSKRSIETLIAIKDLALLPHRKLEETLRSLPGGKYIIEDHYNATAPKPIQELDGLLHSLLQAKKTVSIDKKVEVQLPGKLVTKSITIAKRTLPVGLLDRINRLLGTGPAPETTPAPLTTEPPSTPAPLLEASVSKVIKITPVIAPATTEVPVEPPTTTEVPVESVTTPAPVTIAPEVLQTTPPPVNVVVPPPAAIVPVPVAVPVPAAPAIVVPVTAPPPVDAAVVALPVAPLAAEPTTTPAPLLEVSASKVVKIPVTEENPDAAIPSKDDALKRSVEAKNHRSRRSVIEKLATIKAYVTWPHHKLEELLRSIPGGKFVVEDHYDPKLPKPTDELKKLLISLVGPSKSIEKKVEIHLPTKTITKSIKKEIGFPILPVPLVTTAAPAEGTTPPPLVTSTEEPK